MAIARINGSAASTTAAAASLTLPVINVSNPSTFVIVVILDNTAASVTSITGAAGTATLQASANGTGVRIEIWTIANTSSGNVTLVVNVSPNCNIATAAQNYTGVTGIGNITTNTGSSRYLNTGHISNTETGDWNVGCLGFACVSGDTLTAMTGTSVQTSIPAATAVGVNLCDPGLSNNVNSSFMFMQAGISTSRNWAAGIIELLSGATSNGTGTVGDGTSNIPTGAAMVWVYKAPGPAGSISGVPIPWAENLAGGVTGTAYSEQVNADGGTSPYTFSLLSGSLPTGTTLSSGGLISGTPTVAATYTFTIKATDANGVTGNQTFQIIISTPSSGGAGSLTFVM